MTPERKAVLAAAIILAFGGVGRWATGFVYSSAKAMDLIESVQSSALYLGTALVTGASTILALMLTLVGLMQQIDSNFDRDVYCRVRNIAKLATYSLVGAVVMLLVLTLPVGEFDKLPAQWYPWLYNLLFALVVGLSAVIVATVTLLLGTVSVLIETVTPAPPAED